MKNRASSHLLALLVIAGFQIAGYVAVYKAALLRGYEPPLVGAVRDLLMYVPLVVLLFWLSRRMKYAGVVSSRCNPSLLSGSWFNIAFTASRVQLADKAEARAEKMRFSG